MRADRTRLPGVLAATAIAIDPEDPVSGLEVGDRPEPSVPEGWVRVHVRATSLNHHDVWSLRGVGLHPDQLPIILGCDAAGVTDDGREVLVHALIAEVDPAGGPDRVSILSERHDGTFAEQVVVPAGNLVDKPPELSFEDAACLPTAWLTAYRMLFVRAGLRPGRRVLVQGAGGGVATAALLLARAAGLHVTVTSRDEARLERARQLGANVAVPVGERLPERVHAVVETVGEATWDTSLKALEPDGVVVVSGATSGPNPPADLRRVFARQLRVVGSTMGTRAELVDLLRLLQVSGVRPVVADVLPLTAAREALGRLAAGEVFGKLVLRP